MSFFDRVGSNGRAEIRMNLKQFTDGQIQNHSMFQRLHRQLCQTALSTASPERSLVDQEMYTVQALKELYWTLCFKMFQLFHLQLCQTAFFRVTRKKYGCGGDVHCLSLEDFGLCG